MYYALNLFDVEAGKIDTYREFLGTSKEVLHGLGGSLLALGRLVEPFPADIPNTTAGGGQRWLNVTAYPEFDGPRKLWENADYQRIQQLRSDATKNYVWAYYEAADPLVQE
jgi:hypothetical protein